MPNPHILGLYHKDCPDGTTAAAVLLKKFPHIELHPVGHDVSGAELEKLLERISIRTDVYTVDIAVGARELLTRAKSVTTADHHIGIKDELERIAQESNNFTFVFDNDRSGASLAWRHFFPDESLPELVMLVEDSDLWRLRFGERTRNFILYLSVLVNQPRRVLELFTTDLNPLVEIGAHMARLSEHLIEHFAEGRDPTWLVIGERRVPGYNSQYFESELGHRLSERHGAAVAIFRFKGEQVNFSFRSGYTHEPSALDLAKLLGGGGHRNAAGASVSIQKFVSMLETRA